jgi:hypothetical protein
VGVPFRGLVVGLSKEELLATFSEHGVQPEIRAFSPPMTIAAGLAKRRVLEATETPRKFVRHLLPIVLGFWALEAVVFFLAIASFLFPWKESIRWTLVAVTVTFGFVCVLAGILYLRSAERRGDTSATPRWFDPLWLSAPSDPFGWVLVAAILLGVLLILFVLFVVWLPILLGVVAILSLGELWRDYRTVWLTTSESETLGRIADNLLRRGAVLSKSWDLFLANGNRTRAAAIRQAHYRVHAALVALGLGTLALAAMGLTSRTMPSEAWLMPLLAGGVATVGSAAFLAWALFHRRRFRTRR